MIYPKYTHFSTLNTLLHDHLPFAQPHLCYTSYTHFFVFITYTFTCIAFVLCVVYLYSVALRFDLLLAAKPARVTFEMVYLFYSSHTWISVITWNAGRVSDIIGHLLSIMPTVHEERCAGFFSFNLCTNEVFNYILIYVAYISSLFRINDAAPKMMIRHFSHRMMSGMVSWR